MDMAINIMDGLLGLFAQPVFYLLLLFALWVSYRRVLRERNDFHVRVYGVADGFIRMIVPGLLMGLIGSLVLLGIGIVLPPGMLVLMAVLYFLAMLTFQLRLVSPAFVIGFAVLIAYFLPPFEAGVGVLDTWIDEVQEASPVVTALLLGLLLIIEGVLIRIWGVKATTPRLLPGRRGKRVGAHETRKFWLVPLCLLLPGGVIPGMAWWPWTVGGDGFSLLLVPFGFGFYRLMADVSPKKGVIHASAESVYLGVVVTVIAGIGLYSRLEILAVIASTLAIVFRLTLTVYERVRQGHISPYFRQRNDGLTVLGILPGSPAEKMGIRIGECIQKVNGKPIREEDDFYLAVQTNAAFCKIEVLDEAGEIRFVQGALYEGTHHELGLLFVA